MARGRPRSRTGRQDLTVVTLVVALTSFALGLLSPAQAPLVAANAVRPIKTLVRAMADGTDIGRTLGPGAWVGLNEPSLDQSALFEGVPGGLRLVETTRPINPRRVAEIALRELPTAH
jgi:hypothetical protein